MITNDDICAVLEDIGHLLELKGENPFKWRAYFNAIKVINALDSPVQKLVESGRLSSLKGFGKALTQKITELVETGKLEYYENLKQSVPAGLHDIAALPGLDRRKAGLLYLKLGVTSLEELAQACRDNRLSSVKGFKHDNPEELLKEIEVKLALNAKT